MDSSVKRMNGMKVGVEDVTVYGNTLTQILKVAVVINARTVTTVGSHIL
jgi:hypothetical protein